MFGIRFFILSPKGTVYLLLTVSYISWRQKHMDPQKQTNKRTNKLLNVVLCLLSAFWLGKWKCLHSELLLKSILIPIILLTLQYISLSRLLIIKVVFILSHSIMNVFIFLISPNNSLGIFCRDGLALMDPFSLFSRKIFLSLSFTTESYATYNQSSVWELTSSAWDTLLQAFLAQIPGFCG